MNKRLLGLLALLVLGIGLLFGFGSALTSPKGTPISNRVDLPQTFAALAPFGQQSVVVSTGKTLAEYNYTTGKVTPISPETGTDGLSGIDTLTTSTDKKYILFHYTLAPLDGTLAAILQKAGQDASADYWWVYSVDSKTFKPLPSGVLIAKISGDKVYALAPGKDGEVITAYDLATLSQASTMSITPSSDFLVTTDGFLLQTPDNLIYSTKDGAANKQLFNSSTLIGISNDKHWAVISKTDGKLLSLVAVNLQDNSTKTIVSNITQQPAWSADLGLVLYNTSATTAKYFTYDITTNKTTPLKIASTALPTGDTSPRPTTILDATTFIVSDTTNNYHILGNNINQPQ